MALTFEIDLPYGRYEAALGGWRAEWPPHPARVMCALVASCRDESEREVLRWLEALDPPVVLASAAVTSTREVFVPTNRTERGGSQSWPGRTNGLRSRVTVDPTTRDFAFVWSDTPTSAQLGSLQTLARRVPYLGRATTPCTISVTTDPPPPRQGWSAYMPTTLGESGVSIRVPYRGYLDALCELHEEGGRAWEADRSLVYARERHPEPVPRSARGAHQELLVIAFEPHVSFNSKHALALSKALRRALLSVVDDPIPPALSGHTAQGSKRGDGIPHVALLPLPFVGHDRADGRILGLGVALPDLTQDEAARIYRAILGGKLRELHVRGMRRPISLMYDPFRTEPWTCVPARWTASPRGARLWATATPVVLDRHPRRSLSAEDVLREGAIRAGLPEPRQVVLQRGPAIPGGVLVHRRDLLGDERAFKPITHAVVRFDEPVVGPVLVGSYRYLGLGLFAPLADRRAETSGAEQEATV